MSDLLVTTHTPMLRTGQTLRTYGVARALAAASGGLTLLYARFEGEAPDEAFASIPGIELREVIASRGPRRLLAYAAARARGVPDGFARGVSPELAAEAARLAAAPGRGRVVADGPIAMAALDGLARRRAVVYNAHNIESAFRHELAEESGGRALRRFERKLLACASECWMVSEPDMQAAAELCPGARLRYVPNVVDVSAISPVGGRAPEPRAVFVANFAYEPNLNGMAFLLEKVFPLVWAELPDARLMLVGGGLDASPSQDPRIEAVGFVPDLRAAYASARCAVVPLLQGGGTPLKFVEALAYGLPVLATPRAAAGLEVSDGVDCLLAGDATSFAAKLVAVLRDGAPELGARGRALALERYSIEALTRALA
ncbi:MAG TPA: glycosyltransferase family 4 protein [Solirubrobacteraceae bacterium]|nr:glycosyltransferase family 4 protein [Solirubrobacteraceae bacterium]